MSEIDLVVEINKLNALSKQQEDLRDQFAKINREECSVKNQRHETIKALAGKLRRLLTPDDFQELYKHLPSGQKQGD